VRLRHGDDARVCLFQKTDGRLDTSSLYKALMAAHTPHSACSDFVWKNRAPLGSNSLYGYLCSVVSTAAATSSRNPSSPTQRASCVETTLRRWTTSPSHARLLRRYGNTLVSTCR